MTDQLYLFPKQDGEHNGAPPLERIEGALAFSAIGDALGWPTEFGSYPKAVRERHGPARLEDFVNWQKRVGGRYWGYQENIAEGSYSDDTQLTLAVARCIDEIGEFDVEKFAFLELPAWIHYEKGGGRSIKTAARELISKKKVQWWSNFYRRVSNGEVELDYHNAGANGAAMRVLPIAIVNFNRPEKLFTDCFDNTIITHGHPRAILGCLLYASLISMLLRETRVNLNDVISCLRETIEKWPYSLRDSELFANWTNEWNRRSSSGRAFEVEMNATISEAVSYILEMRSLIDADHKKFYVKAGALTPQMKGSGLSTVLVGAYMFARFHDDPERAIIEAINTLGSDTDTIAYFIGGLFGAHFGLDAIPTHWLARLQDRAYFKTLSEKLHNTLSGKALEGQFASSHFDRQLALTMLFAWEFGLQELFWEAIEEKSSVTHPALGRGVIKRKEIKPLSNKQGYVVKLIEVEFDSGQTCTFHSRVSETGGISESFASDLRNILNIGRTDEFGALSQEAM